MGKSFFHGEVLGVYVLGKDNKFAPFYITQCAFGTSECSRHEQRFKFAWSNVNGKIMILSTLSPPQPTGFAAGSTLHGTTLEIRKG